MPEASPHVLIVIPCHNEAARLDVKIRNTLALTYPAKTIIVIDDHSADQTFERAATWQRHGIQVVRNAGLPGKNAAVATALQRIPSDLLCLTDADVLVRPDALSILVNALTDARVGVACGVQRCVTAERWQREELAALPMTPEDRCSHWLRIVETALDSMVAPHGQFLLVRRRGDAWIEPGIRCDDVEIGLQMRRSGWRVVYVPSTEFYDLASADTGQAAQQRARRGQAVQACFLKHRSVLFNPRYGWFGLICFPLESMLYIVQPALVLIGGGLLVGGLVWHSARHGVQNAAGVAMMLLVAGGVLLRRYVWINAILLRGLLGLRAPLHDRWRQAARAD